MKKLIILLLSFIAISCKKDEAKPEYKYEFTVSPPTNSYSRSGNNPTISNAEIKIFDSETNFNLNSNPLKTLQTDNSGKASTSFNEEKKYWFRISRDTLNNFRSGYINTENNNSNISREFFYGSGNIEKRDITRIQLMLSTIPVKLKLQVFKSGSPVVNKTVTLFLSESELNNRASINYNDVSLWTSNQFIAYGGGNLSFVLIATTDSQGYATFNNLEPHKKYWFSIDNQVPTPSNTGTPLEESNFEVPREIQVALP